MSPQEIRFGSESIKDIARVLGRMFDGIAIPGKGLPVTAGDWLASVEPPIGGFRLPGLLPGMTGRRRPAPAGYDASHPGPG